LFVLGLFLYMGFVYFLLIVVSLVASTSDYLTRLVFKMTDYVLGRMLKSSLTR